MFKALVAVMLGVVLAGCSPVEWQTVNRSVVNVSDICTGVVIDTKPVLVLTAGHCIGSPTAVQFIEIDGVKAKATLMWKAADADAALLRADEKLPPLTAAPIRSTPLHKGEAVYTIAYPLDLKRAYTAGYVSLPEVRDAEFGDKVVVDLTCTFGCSGAAVFDTDGFVIGLVTGPLVARMSPTAYVLLTPARVLRELLAQ